MEKWLKNALNKLIPIVSILAIVLYTFGLKFSILGVGLFLLIEHRMVWNRWDVFDILGHEMLGIVLTITGLILFKSYISAVLVFIIYISFGTYKWSEDGLGVWGYAKKKLNFLEGG